MLNNFIIVPILQLLCKKTVRENGKFYKFVCTSLAECNIFDSIYGLNDATPEFLKLVMLNKNALKN